MKRLEEDSLRKITNKIKLEDDKVEADFCITWLIKLSGTRNKNLPEIVDIWMDKQCWMGYFISVIADINKKSFINHVFDFFKYSQ